MHRLQSMSLYLPVLYEAPLDMILQSKGHVCSKFFCHSKLVCWDDSQEYPKQPLESALLSLVQLLLLHLRS